MVISASLVLVELSEKGERAVTVRVCVRASLHLQYHHLTTFCRLFPSGYVMWGWSGGHVLPVALLVLLTANALQTSSDFCNHQEITSSSWLRSYSAFFGRVRALAVTTLCKFFLRVRVPASAT